MALYSTFLPYNLLFSFLFKGGFEEMMYRLFVIVVSGEKAGVEVEEVGLLLGAG